MILHIKLLVPIYYDIELIIQLHKHILSMSENCYFGTSLWKTNYSCWQECLIATDVDTFSGTS